MSLFMSISILYTCSVVLKTKTTVHRVWLNLGRPVRNQILIGMPKDEHFIYLLLMCPILQHILLRFFLFTSDVTSVKQTPVFPPGSESTIDPILLHPRQYNWTFPAHGNHTPAHWIPPMGLTLLADPRINGTNTSD